MKHTANILNPNKGLITSLLKVFVMFELSLVYERDKVESIAIMCINSKKGTGLYLRTPTLEEMITKFVLNAILHHVGTSWIIFSKGEMLYEIDENNHPTWFNKGPWYNTAIFSRFHEILFEDFITHARTNRYNLLRSIVAHDKKICL